MHMTLFLSITHTHNLTCLSAATAYTPIAPSPLPTHTAHMAPTGRSTGNCHTSHSLKSSGAGGKKKKITIRMESLALRTISQPIQDDDNPIAIRDFPEGCIPSEPLSPAWSPALNDNASNADCLSTQTPTPSYHHSHLTPQSISRRPSHSCAHPRHHRSRT